MNEFRIEYQVRFNSTTYDRTIKAPTIEQAWVIVVGQEAMLGRLAWRLITFHELGPVEVHHGA